MVLQTAVDTRSLSWSKTLQAQTVALWNVLEITLNDALLHFYQCIMAIIDLKCRLKKVEQNFPVEWEHFWCLTYLYSANPKLSFWG